MTTYLKTAYQSLSYYANNILQTDKPHVSNLINFSFNKIKSASIISKLFPKNSAHNSYLYSCSVCQKAKSYLWILINPFSSKIKSASIVTAFASKYFLDISYTTSCLVGFLTFCGLKIYQFKKDNDLNTLALNKKKLEEEKATAKSNAQIIKTILNLDLDPFSKILNSKKGDPLFDQKKQIEDACSYFNTYPSILPLYWTKSDFKDRLKLFLAFQPPEIKALFNA